MKQHENSLYLTEKLLKDYYLPIIFPQENFIHNKYLSNEILLCRPDFRCENLKLIIEFDGYLHFTKAEIVIKDLLKDNTWNKLGYSVIRIPYFLQISPQTIKYLFNIDINIDQIYPHGFHDDKAILPCDFCEQGTYKFINTLKLYPKNIQKEIEQSLIVKIRQLNNRKLVINDQIQYFFESIK